MPKVFDKPMNENFLEQAIQSAGEVSARVLVHGR